MNRLVHEASPYLRQHADNPVDWYPWGDDAFAAARERDVPILLSIGYSACHWCHVMAHESFEDDAVAETDGVKLVVDPISLDLVRGSAVEFVEDLGGASFKVTNPNAASGCGCGSSFSV